MSSSFGLSAGSTGETTNVPDKDLSPYQAVVSFVDLEFDALHFCALDTFQLRVLSSQPMIIVPPVATLNSICGMSSCIIVTESSFFISPDVSSLIQTSENVVFVCIVNS
jgi:hypothetical protein